MLASPRTAAVGAVGAILAFRAAMPRLRALLFATLPMAAASAKGLRFRSWPITETAALEPTLKSMGLKVPAKGR